MSTSHAPRVFGYSADNAAELAVAFAAPSSWFDDDHEPGDRPRCCETVRCVEITLRAVDDRWDEDDVRTLAREVIRGIESLAPRTIRKARTR